MQNQKHLLASALGAMSALLSTPALADDECTYEEAVAEDFNLPADLAGVDVSLGDCAGTPTLFANINIGQSQISVSGQWNGMDEPSCLSSYLEEDPWPGFLSYVQEAKLCYEPSTSTWSASADTSAHIAGGLIALERATFDWSAGSPSFSLGEVSVGPFTISNVELGTDNASGMVLPSSLSGSLDLALPGGGTLQVSGNISEEGFFGIGFDLAGLPANFPFPGVTIPATKASLSFREHGWALAFSFTGTPSLGPLGEIPISEGELQIVVPEEGDWQIAGCLASTPVAIGLGFIDLSEATVSLCADSEGDADVSWQGSAAFPTLPGFGPVGARGSLAKEGSAWKGTLGFEGAFPAGPLGSLDLEGEFSLSGNDNSSAALSGCLQAASSTAMVGGIPADFRFQLGDTCGTSSAFGLSFDGTVQIANQSIAASGSMTMVEDSWSTDVTLTNLALGRYILNDASLHLDSAGDANLSASLDVGAFPLLITGQVEGSSAFDLSVALRSSVDLGNGLVIDDVAGSTLSYDGAVWNLVLRIAGTATIGGTTIGASGDVDASFDESTGEWTIEGCIAADAVPSDIPLTAASGEICWADGMPTLHVSGTLDLGGSSVQVSGSYAPDPDSGELVLELELSTSGSNLILGPGVELEEVKLVVRPGTEQFGISAKLCLGALCMDVSGEYQVGAAGHLNLHMLVTNWQPFSQLAAFNGELTGRIDIDEAGLVSVRYQVSSTQNYQIAPGLLLTHVFAGGRVNSEGEWKLELGGSSDLTFGETQFSVTLRGSVDSDGLWALAGQSDVSFEPLEELLGTGAFVVSDPAFTVSASSSQFTLEMRGQVSMLLVPGAPAIVTTLRGGVVAGDEVGLWFVGALDGLELPGVGDTPWALPALYFAASTAAIDEFDLFDTPEDATDDLRLEQGVTLTTVAELPVALMEDQPSMRLALHLGQTGLKVSGTLDVDIDVIVPEYNLPTISRVTFNSLSLDASISTSGKLEVGFEGTSSFTPSNQDNALVANLRVEVGYMAPRVIFGGQMSIAGRWIEPFGIPRIAIQDPAFKLGFAVTTSYPPVGTLNAIGFNGDGFWLKNGTWPAGFEDTSVAAPSNVVHAGSTFYFELEPSPSGICVGICLPLPPVIARISLHNLSLSDLVETANALKEGIRDMVLAAAPPAHAATLAAALPEADFAPLDVSPFDITVNSLEFYLSTHNIEPWPGIRFESGVHADLDVEVGEHHTELNGKLSMDGLLLEGRVDPITVGDFSLTGNPHSKVANLSQSIFSHVRVEPTTSSNFRLGTIEGWAKTSGASQSYLFQRAEAGRDIQVGFTKAQTICDEENVCVQRAKARLYMRDGKVRRQLLSEALVDVNTWTHLAAVLGQNEVRLVLNGNVVASEKRGVKVTHTGKSYLGSRLDAVDEVRIWNTARTSEQIAHRMRRLPPSANNDSTLLARYSFDYDDGSVAHNSRYYSGNKGHGVFVVGVPSLDERDQKMLLQLKLAISDLEGSGLQVRGGTRFDPRGGNDPISFSTDVLARIGEVYGSIYTPAMTLLDIPGFGKLKLSGDGPNLHAGDFDDGVYGAFSVMDGEFSGSGRLRFRRPSGAETSIAQVNVSYQCPTSQTCSTPSSHELLADGSVDLRTPTPFGELRLRGSAQYSSITNNLLVDGWLRVFGMTASSSQIRLRENDIQLTSSINPGAAFGLNLGNQTLSLRYQYQPARLCGTGTGNLRFPGTATYFSSNTSVCLGSSPSLSIDGTVDNLTLGGINLQNVSVGYSNGRLNLSGHVSVPGVFSGTLSGWYRSPSDFSLSASSNISLGGFRMNNAALRLQPDGFKAQGGLNLRVAQVAATVEINANGHFSLTGQTAMTLYGHSIASANYLLSHNGLAVSGALSVLGNSWNFSGQVHSDGAFFFQSYLNLSIQGFNMASARVSLARHTSAHPRGSRPHAGLRVRGSLAMPYGNSATMDFGVSTSGNYAVNAYQNISLKGWTLTSGRIRFTQDQLSFRGNMNVPGASFQVNTRVYPSGNFSFASNVSLNMGGFALADGYVRFRKSDGLYMRGDARIGNSRFRVSGLVSSLNSWQLCSSSNVQPTMHSFLPSVRGRFCLAKYGSGARLTGSGTTRFHSRTFDANFRISTSGGIEYLYVNEQPNSFSMMGATIRGQIKFKVNNNSLTYFKWTGSLNIWGVVNFSGTIHLSKFKLCPADFGVPLPPIGYSSACAYLYF